MSNRAVSTFIIKVEPILTTVLTIISQTYLYELFQLLLWQ